MLKRRRKVSAPLWDDHGDLELCHCSHGAVDPPVFGGKQVSEFAESGDRADEGPDQRCVIANTRSAVGSERGRHLGVPGREDCGVVEETRCQHRPGVEVTELRRMAQRPLPAQVQA